MCVYMCACVCVCVCVCVLKRETERVHVTVVHMGRLQHCVGFARAVMQVGAGCKGQHVVTQACMAKRAMEWNEQWTVAADFILSFASLCPRALVLLTAGFEDKSAYAQCIFAYTPGGRTHVSMGFCASTAHAPQPANTRSTSDAGRTAGGVPVRKHVTCGQALRSARKAAR